MSDPSPANRGRTPPHGRDTNSEGPFWSWPEVRRGTPVRVLVDLLQYAIAHVLLLHVGVLLMRSCIDFLDSPGGYPETLISAVDGVLVVIILLDILRTVL